MFLPSGRPMYYGIDGHPITASEAEMLFADFYARRVLYTCVTTDRGQCQVSTVFLVFDHAFMGEPPVLWETMTFGGPNDGEQRRYASREAAVAGHVEVVAECRIALDLDGARIVAEETVNGRA